MCTQFTKKNSLGKYIFMIFKNILQNDADHFFFVMTVISILTQRDYIIALTIN